MNTKNPWLDIDWNQKIIAAKDDMETVKDLVQKGIVDAAIPPEPFSGCLDSKVVCLNLNPGERDSNFKDLEAMKKLTEATLNHTIQNSMWLSGKLGTKGTNEHKGCEWWEKRTAMLCETLEIKPDKLKIFVLEYFPYHTKSAFSFPPLASDSYRNYLLDKAMKEQKLIIIMRGARLWGGIKAMTADGITLGDKLSKYENLLILHNQQGAYLTPCNLRKAEEFDLKPQPQPNKCWNELIAKLK